MSETTAIEQTSAATLEAAVVGGDLAKMTAGQRLQWYRTRCDAAGLDPRAQPFAYISLNNKLVLYATKAATDSLAANRNLSVEVMSRQVTEGDIYEVVCRVRDASARVTEDIGAVFVGGVTGEALANARKKAVTQAKRRTIIAHCGLGMLDESETESVPGAARVVVSPAGEVLGELPPVTPVEPVHDIHYWRRYAMALYVELGGDPKDKARCRADAGKDLGIKIETRTVLSLEQWRRWALHLEHQRQQERAPTLGAVEAAESGTFSETLIEQPAGTPAQMQGA